MTALHLRGVVLPGDEERDLWVIDGRISTEPISGAETIFNGGYLVPGMVDAHCHVGLGAHGAVEPEEAVQQAETDRDGGTLLIRDCGSPLDTRPLQERDDLPRLIRAGWHIARPKRYIPGVSLDLADEDQLPQTVAEQAKYGDGWVKLVGDWIDRSNKDAADLAPLWSDEVLAEAIKTAHEHGARVTAHVFGEHALPGLINAGIDCIEHGTGLTDETIELMVSHGTALVPTLINIETFPDIADSAAKYPHYADHMRRLHASSVATVGAAHDAGIPIYAGTDAGGVITHGRIVDEIAALAGAGLGAHGALAAASWSAREWLGVPGISEGAPADLLGYASDPRADLNLLRTPELTLLRGKPVR